VVDIIDALSRSDRERDVLTLAMEALALWYDADVRLYRCDLSDAFVLESCLPGGELHGVAVRLSGASISGRHEVFRLDSMDDVAALGWTGPPDTLFVPLTLGDSTEWLLTVSGAGDPGLAVTLGLLSRVVSVRLTHLHREAVDRLRASLRAVLTFGDAPFDATLRLALEVIARGGGALSAQLATFGDAQRPPVLVAGWACADDDGPNFAEACRTRATSQRITTAVPVGSGLTAVLTLRAEEPGFSNSAVRLAQAAAEMLGVWVSGALVPPREVRVAADSEYSTEFVGRLSGYVDTLGRLRTGGAVAVVLPHGDNADGFQLDEVMQVVQDQVRSTDVVGIVGCGAGVFIADASSEAAATLADRLIRGAQLRGIRAVRVGVATFPPLSESAEMLVRRARINAQREASAS